MKTTLKRLMLGLTILTIVSMPGFAQPQGHCMCMMSGQDSLRSMMQEMTQNPLHQAAMMAFALPAMVDTLALSNEQQSQLLAIKQRMLEGHRTRQQEIQQHQQAIQALFQENPQPDLAALRKHLQAIAQLEVDDRLAPYETLHQMLQVLDNAQRERLHRLQLSYVMTYVMRLPMMDRMPMMHMMHGRSGMMQHEDMPMHHQHEEPSPHHMHQHPNQHR